MTEIFMPKAGMDMKEGRLIRWLKEVGDPVEKDEPVMEIETDKITMEAEAPGSGILLAKTVEEDTWVPVLSVIGYIGEPGEKIPEAPAASPKVPEPSQQEEAPLPSVPGGSAEPAALAPPEKKSREAQTGPSAEREAAAVSGGQKQNPSAPSADSPILATPYAKKAARERGLDLKDIVPGRSDGVIRAADVLATPLARRIAQDQGVDLSAVAGTGCHGKVTKGDVLAAAQSSGAGFAAVQAVKADITCLLDLISQLNGSREKALSLDAFFLKAAALAVQKLSLSSAGFSFAVFGGGEKEQPVVAGAESLSLSRISAQIGELTEKALSHTLSSKETLPAAFGVCDMSSFGVYAFTPVLRSGETGIFGLAAPEDALVLEDGQVTVHKTAVVCLRYDARVLSEAQAAQLLSAMKSLLQTPMEILL